MGRTVEKVRVQGGKDVVDAGEGAMDDRAVEVPKTLSGFEPVRVGRVARRYGALLITAFGSRVEGRARSDSDLDVAVLLRRRLSVARRAGLASAIQAAQEDPPLEVDLVVLNEADPLLRFQVARSGRPLYEHRPEAFLEFQIQAASEYYDNAPQFRAEDAYLDQVYGDGS